MIPKRNVTERRMCISETQQRKKKRFCWFTFLVPKTLYPKICGSRHNICYHSRYIGGNTDHLKAKQQLDYAKHTQHTSKWCKFYQKTKKVNLKKEQLL